MSTDSPRHFDVIIIGSGSGNAIPSPEFDDVSIALVEEGRFGGTCLNVGCIPTKMLVLAADAARNVSEAARLGVHAHVDSIDWQSMQKRIFADRIDAIADGGEQYRRGPETPNIEVFDGHASFIGPRTLSTAQGDTACTITADHIIVAAGSRTYIPPVVAQSGVRFYTNSDIMRLAELPEEMIILGGGFIATEFAHVFSSLGVKVHVIVRSGAMNRQSDADISERFTQVASRNWDVHFNATIDSLSETNGIVTAKLSTGAVVKGGVFLVATGRVPNGDRMNLPAGNIECTDNHRIVVDSHGRTSADGVWALGDASSPHQLKHIANHEAKVVFHNVLQSIRAERAVREDVGGDVNSRDETSVAKQSAARDVELRSVDHRFVPSAIFSHPHIGQVGMTEAEAQQWAESTGGELTIKIQNYGDVAYGWALEDRDGCAKLIADKNSGRLLGAHFIGEQAATLVQQCIQMMAFDLDLRDVVENQHWIHPALPEVIENAIYGLEFNES